MAGVIAATVVSGIGGALIGAGAANSAADKQVQASREAQAAQERMFEKQIALQEPYRQGGLTAQNRLLTLLGLNPNAGQPAAPTGPRAITTPYGTFNYPGALGDYALSGMEGYAPGMGTNALAVDRNSPDFGRYARDFGMADFEADPGYAFRVAEGQKAIERSAAARGGLQSGSALKAAARFGQEMGSQEYANAFNRYQTNRANQLNPLFMLMNTGIGAANTLTGAAGQLGQNQANAINAQGYYGAMGDVGAANAWGNAFSNIGSTIGSALARKSSYGDIPAGWNTGANPRPLQGTVTAPSGYWDYNS